MIPKNITDHYSGFYMTYDLPPAARGGCTKHCLGEGVSMGPGFSWGTEKLEDFIFGGVVESVLGPHTCRGIIDLRYDT